MFFKHASMLGFNVIPATESVRCALLPAGRTGRTVAQTKPSLSHRAQGAEVDARSHRSLSS